MPGQTVGIFIATMTGLAELCADEISAALQRAGFAPTVKLMDVLTHGALDEYDAYVIVSSTYGHGDIPDNGQAFFAAVSDRDRLDDKSFCVFALGDRTYADTFCHAGEKWDELLQSKRAIRLAPLERHDASSGTLAEDVAGAWAERWINNLKKAA